MLIEAGFDIAFECPAQTPMLLQLNVHPSRDADLLTPDRIASSPPLAMRIGELVAVAISARDQKQQHAAIRNGPADKSPSSLKSNSQSPRLAMPSRTEARTAR